MGCLCLVLFIVILFIMIAVGGISIIGNMGLPGLVLISALITAIIWAIINYSRKADQNEDSQDDDALVEKEPAEPPVILHRDSEGHALLTESATEINNDPNYIVDFVPAPDRIVSETVGKLMDRAYISLNAFQFDEADRLFERVLDEDPHFSPAYIGKILCELAVRDEKLLAYSYVPLFSFTWWHSAMRFATEAENDSYTRILSKQNLLAK